MADKIPTGTRLDSLSRLSSSASSNAPKPGLKFKPKTVARRTKEERAADAPVDRPDLPKSTQHPRKNTSARGGRGGARGGRALQGTHLVQSGPLSSTAIETTQVTRSVTASSAAASSVIPTASSSFLSRLTKKDPSVESRESTPGLDSDDDSDDLTKINMSEDYKFSQEESELFPVRAPRSDHDIRTDSQIFSTANGTREATPGDVDMIDSTLFVKDEPGNGNLDSLLKQKDQELHNKLNQLGPQSAHASGHDDVDDSEMILNDHRTIVKEILEIDNQEDKFLMFQLPRILPEFVNPHGPDQQMNPPIDLPMNPPTEEAINLEDGKQVQQKKPKVSVEGQIGKLRIHKSGKVTITIGDVVMDVGRGSNTEFLQEVVLMDKSERHESYLLGHLQDKIVITPSFK